MRRRNRFPPPKPFVEDPHDLAKVKQIAENRMSVFSAAPRRVQEASRQFGEVPLLIWWQRQSDYTVDDYGRCIRRQRYERLW